MPQEEMLRKIPKVDVVLSRLSASGRTSTPPHIIETESVREIVDGIREEILAGVCAELPSEECVDQRVMHRIAEKSKKNLRRVVNATGIVLHTNLGRARLGEKAVSAVVEIAQSYSNLEYDIEQGARGSRHAQVEELITRLTGAQSAMVVNNNAAAVLLILHTIARGKKVIISRGELVEIGDSFRIPAIIEQSGSILTEVGTTNKTHLSDYEAAIDPEHTAALLKVHTSNFKIVGFADTPSLKNLAGLGQKHGMPVIFDAGSGMMTDLHPYGIDDEPLVPQCVADGADIICFSGDKLMGGPQAGIIVGQKVWINMMKKNQLARALRIDKLTLAALEATLRSYLEGTAEQDIPTLNMISTDRGILAGMAKELCERIRETVQDCAVEIVEEFGQVGGGAVPGQLLPTFAVAVQPRHLSVTVLESRIRRGDTPIVARISKDRLLLDVRTLEEADFPYIASRIAQSLCS
jgi:L-seryl-tRNA(Ser) seleniumtransferase